MLVTVFHCWLVSKSGFCLVTEKCHWLFIVTKHLFVAENAHNTFDEASLRETDTHDDSVSLTAMLDAACKQKKTQVEFCRTTTNPSYTHAPPKCTASITEQQIATDMAN